MCQFLVTPVLPLSELLELSDGTVLQPLGCWGCASLVSVPVFQIQNRVERMIELMRDCEYELTG
jgi:hypothetical protein